MRLLFSTEAPSAGVGKLTLWEAISVLVQASAVTGVCLLVHWLMAG